MGRITRKQLTRAAAKHGGTIDWQPGDSVIYADAKPGTAWDASDCHVITAAYDDGDRQAAYRYLLSELAHGVRPCDCEDCRAALADAARSTP